MAKRKEVQEAIKVYLNKRREIAFKKRMLDDEEQEAWEELLEVITPKEYFSFIWDLFEDGRE